MFSIYFFNLALDLKEMDLIGDHEVLVDAYSCHTYTPGTFPFPYCMLSCSRYILRIYFTSKCHLICLFTTVDLTYIPLYVIFLHFLLSIFQILLPHLPCQVRAEHITFSKSYILRTSYSSHQSSYFSHICITILISLSSSNLSNLYIYSTFLPSPFLQFGPPKVPENSHICNCAAGT